MAEHTTDTRKRLSPERQADIADLAESVVETNCSSGRIDPAAIIQAKGIALIYDHYENAFDGMLEYDSGEFFIHCNLDRENTPGSPRARFTLAHELGHYFIDEHRNNLVSGEVRPHPSLSDTATSDLLVEREADFFASRLLVPDSRFVFCAKRVGNGLTGIVRIAAEFEVSITCAAVRYVSSGLFPCVVLKWADSDLSWKWCSREFWNLGFRKTIETAIRLPPGSATLDCIGEADSMTSSIRSNAATAAYWFPHATMGSAWNIVLQEEAMSLGRFGTITVLTPHRGSFPRELLAARAHELGAE